MSAVNTALPLQSTCDQCGRLIPRIDHKNKSYCAHCAAWVTAKAVSVVVLKGTKGGHTVQAQARALAPSLPFRAPHYTASVAGMVDECRLAAGGVLYLDDAANVSRAAIEAIARTGGLSLVVLDGSPLRPVGLGEYVPDDVQERHTRRVEWAAQVLGGKDPG